MSIGSSAATHFHWCDLADDVADIEWPLAIHPQAQTFFAGHTGLVTRGRMREMVERRSR